MADFVFATCLPGMEPALKLDVARARPELRLAYSRPGLVTFKSTRTVAPDDTPGSVFAHVWGRSVGAASDPATAALQLASLGATRVHVFAREPEGPPPEEPRALGKPVPPLHMLGLVREPEGLPAPDDPRAVGEAVHSHRQMSASERERVLTAQDSRLVGGVPPSRAHVVTREPGSVATAETSRAAGGLALATRASISDAGSLLAALLVPWQAVGPGGPAQLGELVADVIVAPAAGEPAWLGVHRHDRFRLPHAGGAIPVEVPADAPSRAYAKIEEAIAWAALPVEAGHVALEIGAAPGGAALALARRGLEVWAVDTGALAPTVVALPGVHHLAKKVGALRWEELPARIDWLLVDVNLAPQVALHEVGRLMPRLVKTLRGAVFTLKLNDWTFVSELPALVERIRQIGLPDVRMRHLPSNRREVCAVALR